MGSDTDLESCGEDRLARWGGNLSSILDIRTYEHDTPAVSAFALGAAQESAAFDDDIAECGRGIICEILGE